MSSLGFVNCNVLSSSKWNFFIPGAKQKCCIFIM